MKKDYTSQYKAMSFEELEKINWLNMHYWLPVVDLRKMCFDYLDKIDIMFIFMVDECELTKNMQVSLLCRSLARKNYISLLGWVLEKKNVNDHVELSELCSIGTIAKNIELVKFCYERDKTSILGSIGHAVCHEQYDVLGEFLFFIYKKLTKC